jgi:hypothetical protein
MTRYSVLFLALAAATPAQELQIARPAAGIIEVRRPGAPDPILVQNAPAGMRPYIHPLLAPDGKGVLTQFRPDHHKHQTGIFLGFANVNGRSFFHNFDETYFRGREAKVTSTHGRRAAWSVVTDWLAGDGSVLLTETQRWTMEDFGDHYVLDLYWSGLAAVDITMGKYDYGGLFIRMPWHAGVAGEAINSDGLRGKNAEGKRARWVDVGMAIDGRADWAHIAMMDHRGNPDHPAPWRVDANLGVVPSRSRLGEWKIKKDETAQARYRLLVYTGELNKSLVEKAWNADWK